MLTHKILPLKRAAAVLLLFAAALTGFGQQSTPDITFLVTSYSSSSPLHALFPQLPSNVQVLVFGKAVDHYRITLRYTDPQGESQRLVKYCDYDPSPGPFPATVCVILTDAPVITSVLVEPFPTSVLTAQQGRP